MTDNAPTEDPTIDLHLVFVGVSGLDASSAESDSDVQGLIDGEDEDGELYVVAIAGEVYRFASPGSILSLK